MSFRSKHFRFFIVLFLAITVIASAQSDAKPKNIIFMIGDGMGVAHVTAAKIVKGSIDMERCKVMGMHMTASADNPVTDSAAAGTAPPTDDRRGGRRRGRQHGRTPGRPRCRGPGPGAPDGVGLARDW